MFIITRSRSNLSRYVYNIGLVLYLSDLGDGWDVAFIETKDEYYFISLNHDSLVGDRQYFIGGSIIDDFYDYYGGTFRDPFVLYSPREEGTRFKF